MKLTDQELSVLCVCGHARKWHANENNRGGLPRIGDCCASVEGNGFSFCQCKRFREHQFKSQEEIEMAKKNGATKKKGEGRTPTLAPYADTLAGKTIYMNHDGKEHTASVLTSGVIRMNDKDYTSPSSAGSAILGKDKKGNPRQVDGWKSWYFNKDGERVMLNTLRGSKSPLKIEAAAPKREKRTKSANGAAKKPRKRRADREAPAQEQAAAPAEATA